MRNELQQIAEIEQYLEGKMGEQQRMDFEDRMQADEQLNSQVKIQEQLTQRIKINAFRNEILNFHSTYTATATTRSKGYRFYLNALLLFGVLGSVAVAVYYLWPAGQEPVLTQKGKQTEEVLPAQKQETYLVTGEPVVAEKNPNEPATAVHPDHKKEKVLKTLINDDDELPTPSTEDIPNRDFILSTHSQMVNASVGGDVVTKESKSVIHFPGGIMTDQQGNAVTGMVEIKYREYRNAADMAFSGIPMVYSEGGKKYRFNSAGMFDIRAYQNGKELKIKPGSAFRVDYNVTEKKDSCYFFALDEKTKTWKKISPIDFKPRVREERVSEHTLTNPQGNGQIFVRIRDAVSGKDISKQTFASFINPAADLYETNIMVDSFYNVSSIVRGSYEMQLAADGYRKMKVTDIKVFDGRITYIDARLSPVQHSRAGEKAAMETDNKKEVVAETDKTGFWQSLFKKRKKNFTKGNGFTMRNSTDKVVLLPVKEKGDIAHRQRDTLEKPIYIPGMVEGLRCESFGVYNCDQVYLLKEPVDIRAAYKNAAGEPITNGYVVSMIDMAYNGAFSFDPANFTCSRSGKNVVLLFTQDKKLYALSSESFKKMGISGSGAYTFTMTDITARVKNAEELRQYLHLP